MDMLAGKVAIVTGASTGIGRAAALLFARQGAAIVASARNERALESLAAEIGEAGGRAAIVAGEIGDERLAQHLVAVAQQRFGGLDVAFNNAGAMGSGASFAELERAEWDAVLATNLTASYLHARHQIPAMLARGGGSLIFTSTFVGYTAGMPGMAAYAASKAGLIGLTRVLACEYGARGIRVNALLPGGTDTPLGRSFASTPQAQAFVRGLHALKRIADPEEIAHSALYLASDASSFTTGSALLVDGGVSINRV